MGKSRWNRARKVCATIAGISAAAAAPAALINPIAGAVVGLVGAVCGGIAIRTPGYEPRRWTRDDDDLPTPVPQPTTRQPPAR